MNKFKTIIEWIKRNNKLIIISLLVLLMLKGCNSCTTKKRYEYKINQYKIQVDSLQNTVEKYIIDYNDLRDSLSEQIHILESNNILLQDAINNARKDIEYQRRVNTDLVDVTKNLSSNNDNETTNK